MDPLSTFGIFAFVFGLLVGSFLNVVIARLPVGKSVIHPPSHCPRCGTPIRAYDNIPIISWVLLGRKCRACHTPISSIYPAVELLTGLLAWLLYRSIFIDISTLSAPFLGAFLVYFALIAMLVAQSFIDIRYYIIPDELSIYAVPFAILAMAVLSAIGYPMAIGWKASVLGAFFGGGVLLAVAAVWWLIRRQAGMGMGDVKLLALIGACCGVWPALPFIILVASLSASLIGVPISLSKGGLRYALPFGPFLAFAAIVWLLNGPVLVERWLPGWELIAFP
ncbi:MAG: prepilin peptidase [Myxococcota bacterium]